MKITYAVTVCNEFIEIQRLIKFLLENKRMQDEIVVLYDAKNGDVEVESFLRANSINGEFAWHKAEFQGHFADWKNKLTSLCTGHFIFQMVYQFLLLLFKQYGLLYIGLIVWNLHGICVILQKQMQ